MQKNKERFLWGVSVVLSFVSFASLFFLSMNSETVRPRYHQRFFKRIRIHNFVFG